jgi:hypothetical protein
LAKGHDVLGGEVDVGEVCWCVRVGWVRSVAVVLCWVYEMVGM